MMVLSPQVGAGMKHVLVVRDMVRRWWKRRQLGAE